MKQIISVLCCLLFLAAAQAAEIDITAKTPIGVGAVAIFEIKANVNISQEIGLQQIQIKNNNSERISAQLSLKRQANNTYLLATNLPKDLQEYITVSIEDVEYLNNNQLQQTTNAQDFTLTEVTQLHIMPPIVALEVESYQNPTITLQVTNKGMNTTTIQPQSSFTVITSNVEISAEETEFVQVKANIATSNATEIEGTITIGQIIIPVYITRYGVPKTQIEETTEREEPITQHTQEQPTIIFVEEEKELNRILKQDQILEGPLRIKNTAATRIENLQIKLTNGLGEIVRAKLEKSALNPEESTEIRVSINERKMLLKEYRGELQVFKEDKVLATFPIRIRPSTGEEITPAISKKEQERPQETEIKKEEEKKTLPLIILFLLIAAAATFWYLKNKSQGQQKYPGFKPRR